MTAARIRIYAYLWYCVSAIGAVVQTNGYAWEFWLPFSIALLMQIGALRRD